MKKHLIASAVVLSFLSFMAGPPAVADSGRAQSVMNQSGVYESTLQFFLHPARLEWSSTAPSQLGEHPAVLVSRNLPHRGYDYSKFYPHPARLGLSTEAPAPVLVVKEEAR
ncbi:MAG TPA: hypothetical protein VLA73_02800 [Burkholderiales bacterium]|nr:hypothetical protein [Burkholderiales bacterium]